jgi:hypothetical protein
VQLIHLRGQFVDLGLEIVQDDLSCFEFLRIRHHDRVAATARCLKKDREDEKQNENGSENERTSSDLR